MFHWQQRTKRGCAISRIFDLHINLNILLCISYFYLRHQHIILLSTCLLLMLVDVDLGSVLECFLW